MVVNDKTSSMTLSSCETALSVVVEPPSDLDTNSVFSSCTAVVTQGASHYGSGLEGIDLEDIEDEGVITNEDLSLPIDLDNLAEKLMLSYNNTISPRISTPSDVKDHEWVRNARFLKVFYKLFPLHTLNNASGVLRMIYKLGMSGGEQSVRGLLYVLLETFHYSKVASYVSMPTVDIKPKPETNSRVTDKELLAFFSDGFWSLLWTEFLYGELRDGNHDSNAIADEFLATFGSLPNSEELPRPLKRGMAESGDVGVEGEGAKTTAISSFKWTKLGARKNKRSTKPPKLLKRTLFL